MSEFSWLLKLFVISQLVVWGEYWALRHQALFFRKNPYSCEFYFLFLIAFLSLIGLLVSEATSFVVLYALTWTRMMVIARGNFNGGSDNMTFVVLTGILIARFTRQESTGLIYIALLSTSSYFFAGWVKARKSEWWQGRSLMGFLRLSPLRLRPWQLKLGSEKSSYYLSRVVLFFECSFPLALLHPALTWLYLVGGTCFHIVNFRFFGLNRFFWVWLSTYPALLWFTK